MAFSPARLGFSIWAISGMGTWRSFPGALRCQGFRERDREESLNEGHGFSRAVNGLGAGRKEVPQGLKPDVFSSLAARLKSCPDTKPSFSAASSAVPQLFCRRRGFQT